MMLDRLATHPRHFGWMIYLASNDCLNLPDLVPKQMNLWWASRGFMWMIHSATELSCWKRVQTDPLPPV